MLDPQVLKAVLEESFHATVDGNTYHIKEELRAAVMVQHAGGVLMISKVLQVTFQSAYIVVATSDELTYLDPKDIFAIRRVEAEEESKDKRPGFRA